MSDNDFIVLLLNATAQAGCSSPQGSRHQIIVIAAVSAYEDAREITLRKLAENFWSDVDIQRHGPLMVDMADNDYLRGAVADAQEHGFGLVVYETKN